MKCKISSWGCVYHACMSDDCQRRQVYSTGARWGSGNCSSVFRKIFEDYQKLKSECMVRGIEPKAADRQRVYFQLLDLYGFDIVYRHVSLIVDLLDDCQTTSNRSMSRKQFDEKWNKDQEYINQHLEEYCDDLNQLIRNSWKRSISPR